MTSSATTLAKKKNATRIGTSLLGTWTTVTRLENEEGDELTAYMIVHFMPDPRQGQACRTTPKNCSQIDNQVCQYQLDDQRPEAVQQVCKDIASEKNVAWSDCK